MNTVEYLDEIKRKRDIPSDYALAKLLGVSKQAISNYRALRSQFDDAVSLRAAELLGIHPAIVILDIRAERADTQEYRDLWQEITRGFWQVAPKANDRRRAPRPI